MIKTQKALVAVGVFILLVPLLSLAQSSSNSPFSGMQECLTARGASSPPSLQDLQACSPKPSSSGSAARVSVPTSATAGSCANITRTLQKGSRGTDVTSLQNFLISQGHLSAGNNTGYFGALTESAVQKFQCSQSIVCSGTPSSTGYGLVGAKTRAAIQRVCSGTASTPTSPSSSGGSMSDTLNAQLKQLQERIAALRGGAQTSATTQTSSTGSSGCTFNGTAVANGASITAYKSSSVASGESCVFEKRSCTNGTLSGTYRYASCAVSASPATTLSSTYENGELRITFNNAPNGGKKNDWIGVYTSIRSSYADHSGWKYTNNSQTATSDGIKSGTVTFTGLNPGTTYDARYFSSGNTTPVTTKIVHTGTQSSSLSVTPSEYSATVSFTGGYGNAGDWIGLFDANGNLATWQYLDGTTTGTQVKTSGTLTFYNLAAGSYTARMYEQTNGERLVASADFSITGSTSSAEVSSAGSTTSTNTSTFADGYVLKDMLTTYPQTSQWRTTNESPLDSGRYPGGGEHRIYSKSITLKAGDMVRTSAQIEATEEDKSNYHPMTVWISVSGPSTQRVSNYATQQNHFWDGHHMPLMAHGVFYAPSDGTYTFEARASLSSTLLGLEYYGHLTLEHYIPSTDSRAADAFHLSEYSRAPSQSDQTWAMDTSYEPLTMRSLWLNADSGDLFRIQSMFATSLYTGSCGGTAVEMISVEPTVTTPLYSARSIQTTSEDLRPSPKLWKLSHAVDGVVRSDTAGWHKFGLDGVGLTIPCFGLNTDTSSTNLEVFRFSKATSAAYRLLKNYDVYPSSDSSRQFSSYSSGDYPWAEVSRQWIKGKSGDIVRTNNIVQADFTSGDLGTGSALCMARTSLINGSGTELDYSYTAARAVSNVNHQANLIAHYTFKLPSDGDFAVISKLYCRDAGSTYFTTRASGTHLLIDHFSAK